MGGLLLSAWGTIHSQMGNGSLSSMKRACRQPHLIIYSGDNVPEWRRKASSRPASRKGNSYERVWSVMRCLVCVGCCTGFCAMISQANRRKGRPAWTRNPDDTPLRDGNRDRLIGLLTERAAKTLLYYLSETNLHVFHWFQAFIKAHPIPRNGDWDDVSGETFLRTLLAMSPDQAKFDMGRDQLYDCTGSITVDPRQLAQRVMEIRSQISQEFVQDLQAIAEENSILLRETLAVSLSLDATAEHPLESDLEMTSDEDVL